MNNIYSDNKIGTEGCRIIGEILQKLLGVTSLNLNLWYINIDKILALKNLSRECDQSPSDSRKKQVIG